MNDGIIAQDVNVLGSEVRIPVEVWKDDKMLFPTYDESVPGRNLVNGSARGTWGSHITGSTVSTQEGGKTNTIRVESSLETSGVSGASQNSSFRKMKLSSNKEYTLSFLVRGNAPTLNYTYLMNSGTDISNQNVGTISGTNSENFIEVHKTFTPNANADISTGSYLLIAYLGDRTGKWFEFKEVKLEEGNNPNPVWTLTPEEILELAKITTTNCSYKIDGDELVLYGFTDNNGTVNIEVSYGDDWVRSKSTTWTANFSSRSLEIFKYASSNGYVLPTKQVAYDEYIRGLINSGLFDKLDLHYIFSGDGDINFKLINVINPGIYNGTAFGGLEWSNEGVKGNGVNGYVDTNFNPALLVEGQRYQLNDASRGAIVFDASGAANIDSAYGYSENIIFNSLYRSRINQGSTSFTSDVNQSGLGLKTISRRNEIDVFLTSLDNGYDRQVSSTVIRSAKQVVLRYGGGEGSYAAKGIASYMMGASLTYEETQQFRQLFNKYLISNNLQEIA